MTAEDWNELESLDPDSIRAEELLKKTEDEREHPEWYEGACFCRYCMECAQGD